MFRDCFRKIALDISSAPNTRITSSGRTTAVSMAATARRRPADSGKHRSCFLFWILPESCCVFIVIQSLSNRTTVNDIFPSCEKLGRVRAPSGKLPKINVREPGTWCAGSDCADDIEDTMDSTKNGISAAADIRSAQCSGTATDSGRLSPGHDQSVPAEDCDVKLQ